MSFRNKVIPFIFMNTQVKFLVFLNNGCIQGGEQNMLFPFELFKGTNQEAMVFPGITSYNGHAGIGTGPI